MSGSGRGTQGLKADSKLFVECPVDGCQKKGARKDNWKTDILKLVIFDEDGEMAVSEDNSCFKKSSQLKQQHTNFWRIGGYLRKEFPQPIPVKKSPASVKIFSHFRRERDQNNSIITPLASTAVRDG